MYEDRWGEVERYFKNSKYDAVGITCMSGQYFNCFKLAQIVKVKMSPPPIVILGGPHPSAQDIDTQMITHYPQLDFIVRDEGEDLRMSQEISLLRMRIPI